ncbi:MAG: hypothetical protein KAS72_02260 [Phycisphaerales bacterium]|nr:hypothetical protein [Phycisphaerales bacterium]
MKLTRAAPLLLVVAGMSGFALAEPVDPYYIDGPQDPLFLAQDFWHELGNGFPPEELIESIEWPTDETSCFDGSDDPYVPNMIVEMINLTPTFWWDLHYVADPETSLTNFDGWIGNFGLNDAEEAFRIDYQTINRPLVFESMTANEIFEPGEIWWFIIQDYGNAMGGPASDFSSVGIASMSTGWPPSTGSIIAREVPVPATLPLLGLAGLLMSRRR